MDVPLLLFASCGATRWRRLCPDQRGGDKEVGRRRLRTCGRRRSSRDKRARRVGQAGSWHKMRLCCVAVEQGFARGMYGLAQRCG